jgi:HPt (histidine-containing phosphotransfer) domain-containing protein
MSAGEERLDHSSPISPATSAAEPFEIAALLRRCMGDHEFAARLIEKFTGRLADTVKEIERGVEAKDWSSVTSRLHNLKGEAGSLAAVELASSAEEMRERLFDGHIHAASTHLLELKAAADRCIQFRFTIAKRLEQAASVALHG